MLRNIIFTTTFLLTFSSNASGALTLRTEANAVCEVERYEERYDGDVCGWNYYEKRTNACELDYHRTGPDMSCPGSNNGRWTVVAQVRGSTGPNEFWWGNGEKIQGGEDITKLAYTQSIETTYWSCSYVGYLITSGSMPRYTGEQRCTAKPYAASCSLPKFGSVYKPCRASSHGNESPKKCRSDKFSPELYKTCSFYKTPEEIDAYIEATTQTLVNNSILLPTKQSDLYTTFRQEASFICLVEKYSGVPGYEDVVADLTAKFFATFGYEFNESSLTCADASTEDRTYRIVAGALDCKNYDITTIRSVVKPADMVQAVFTRFKSNCTTKVTYDYLVGWFDTRIGEVNQLLEDVVAKRDAARKLRLEDLKQNISESK